MREIDQFEEWLDSYLLGWTNMDYEDYNLIKETNVNYNYE